MLNCFRLFDFYCLCVLIFLNHVTRNKIVTTFTLLLIIKEILHCESVWVAYVYVNVYREGRCIACRFSGKYFIKGNAHLRHFSLRRSSLVMLYLCTRVVVVHIRQVSFDGVLWKGFNKSRAWRAVRC